MIEFHCHHCGKLLRLDDSYAGRDGWCRVCKRMVIVPGGRSGHRLEDLPPEEGYARIQLLLQYAATKADLYRIHMANKPREEQTRARLEAASKAAHEALAAEKARYARLQADHETAEGRAAELETALRRAEEALADREGPDARALQETLEAEHQQRETLEARLVELESALATARQDYENALDRIEDLQRAGREGASDSADSRAALQARLDAAERERDRLAQRLDEAVPEEQESARRLIEQEQKTSELEAAVARLTASAESARQEAAGRAGELETALDRARRAEERAAALEKTVKSLEQARESSGQATGQARDKLAALEGSLHEASTANASLTAQVEQLQQALEGRGEEVRRLSAALEAAGRDRATTQRASEAAEARATTLSAELEVQGAAHETLERDRDAAERANTALRAQVASLNDSLAQVRESAASGEERAPELEAEAQSLRAALHEAREKAAADGSAADRAIADLRKELASATAALQEARESDSREAAKASPVPALEAQIASLREELRQEREHAATIREARQREREQTVADQEAMDDYVAELEADVMTIRQSIKVRGGSDADPHEPVQALAKLYAEAADTQEALDEARGQVRILGAQLEQLQAGSSRSPREEERLAGLLEEARAENARLQEALAELRADGGGFDQSDFPPGDADVVVLEAREPRGAGESPAEPVSNDAWAEKRRQQEKQQMMDVLSEFLDK